MFLSHTKASLSPINRYPVCIVFFPVSYQPDGLAEGKEESSSKIITWDEGRVFTPFPPVS